MEQHVVNGCTLIGVSLTAVALMKISTGWAVYTSAFATIVLFIMGLCEMFSKKK